MGDTKELVYEDTVRGYDWYKCPYCNFHISELEFEILKMVRKTSLLERTDISDIYKHIPCGNKIKYVPRGVSDEKEK